MPDYVLNGDPEPGEAAGDRSWVYNLIWSIYAPGRQGATHSLGWRDIIGDQNSQNFEYFLAYMARILEGRPLKRTAFLFPPKGAEFEKCGRVASADGFRDLFADL